MEYATRFTNAEARCGNVHRGRELKLMFIDGLDPAIKPLVSRYNKKNRRAELLEVIDFAQDEGNAQRARSRTSRRGDPLRPQGTPAATTGGRGRTHDSANLIEGDDQSSVRYVYPSQSFLGFGEAELHMVQESGSQASVMPRTD